MTGHLAPASNARMADNARNATVDIRIAVPTDLHNRLRRKALDQGSSLKAVVLDALAASLVPGPDQARAEGARHVIALLDLGRRDGNLGEARAKAVAYVNRLDPVDPTEVPQTSDRGSDGHTGASPGTSA